MGSYVAAAVTARDFSALGWAILTMVVLIVLIDIFFWRLLVAWADRFKLELSAGTVPRYWLLEMFRAAHVPSLLSRMFSPITLAADRVLSKLTSTPKVAPKVAAEKSKDPLFDAILVVSVVGLVSSAIRFTLKEVCIA